MSDKVIVSAALTGAMTDKKLSPYIPLTPAEIAEDAYNCWKAGAAIVHLHMRDENGIGTMDRDKFEETIRLIRAHEDCDVVINCTSSGTAKAVPYEERMEHFRTIPEIEMGSFDAGSFNWGCFAPFDNSPKFLEQLAQCYIDHDVLPELEIFDMGMIGNINYYVKKGLLPKPLLGQICLGILGGAPATVAQLQHLVNNLPEGMKWSAFGIGKDHLPIMYAALALGADGVRVGLEDNVMYSKGVHASNVMLVERAVRVVKEFGKTPATSAEAREILGLKPLVR